jgi:glycerophosphoryl diester phosphodiesterase
VTFVVAHRAGNDVRRLKRAEALELPLIEADLHLYRGRIEVRHLKTLGPIPLLWDKWTLAPPWRPRLLLDQLLAAPGPDTELMLDLKGHDVRLPRQLGEALQRTARRGRVTVCSRNWRLLESLRDTPSVRLVHSVGSRRQLRALHRLFSGSRLAGISIHRDLLDPAQVHELRRRAGVVMSWPVETVDEARRLSDWGVDGLISQNFEVISGAVA